MGLSGDPVTAANPTDLGTVAKVGVALDGDVAADCALAQDATALLGYAFDGFPMLGSLQADGTCRSGRLHRP